MDDVAFPVAFMGINNSQPAVFCDSAAIAPRPTGSVELVPDIISQYFIGGMMPDSAKLVQQSRTVIENSAMPRRLAVLRGWRESDLTELAIMQNRAPLITRRRGQM